jgi:hypothetical protein
MSKVLIKKNVWMILVLAFSVVFSAACSKNANTGNSTISTNSTTTSNTTSNTSSSSTGGATAGGPTAALKAYYEAANKRDFEAAKRYLSAGTMRIMEEGAKKMGKTVDEAFRDSPEQTITPEFLNEKINGDTATVDLKAQDMTITMPMVKENGEWKLAMDKMMEDLQKSMGGGEVKGGPKDDDDNDNK